WPSDYGSGNTFGVPGAASTYDFGDQPTGSSNYGSMQIHNYGAQQTIFAFNRWGGDGGTNDLGISNQVGGSGHPDWTFAQNADTYVLKHLYVLVQAAPSITSATSAIAGINHAFSYTITAANSPTSFN